MKNETPFCTFSNNLRDIKVPIMCQYLLILYVKRRKKNSEKKCILQPIKKNQIQVDVPI